MHFIFTVGPVIEDFKFDGKLQAGMRTRIYCNVAQGDLPLTITWLKDGKPLNQLNDPLAKVSIREMDQFSKALLMEQLSPVNNGNYTCQVSNDAATVTHSAQLIVNGKQKTL